MVPAPNRVLPTLPLPQSLNIKAIARRPACGLQAANSPPGAAKNGSLRRKTRYFAHLLRCSPQLRKTRILRHFSLPSAFSGPGAAPLAPSARLATLPSASPSRSLPVRARPHCRSRLGCTSCSPSCAPAVLPSPCPAVPVPSAAAPLPARCPGPSPWPGPVPMTRRRSRCAQRDHRRVSIRSGRRPCSLAAVISSACS